MQFTLEILPWSLSICQLSADEELPAWALKSEFLSITRSPDELSIVCLSNCVPQAIDATSGWSSLRIVGPLDFELTGIMAELIAPLAEADVSIFAVSTYQTDYILVRSGSLDEAVAILGQDHDIIGG